MESKSKCYTVVTLYMAWYHVVGLLIGMLIMLWYCSCYIHTVCTLQDGWTALMLAALNGHKDTMQALAALGADIHIQDKVS